ncbi:MAG: S41 family peptidase [Woeseia sp.]
MTPLTRSTTCRVGRWQGTTAFLALALALAGCGGGGGGSDIAPGGNGGNGSNWTPGVFLDASTFRNQCVAPRSGTNPATGNPYPDVAGTRTDENNFLRSYSNDTYLWYDEIVDRDPALYETLEYFDLLQTDATTASGAPKDKFHFTYPTDEWFELSQSGSSAGYGVQWVLLQSFPPRKALVAYTDPNTPADDANLLRGAEVLEVDGVDLINGNDVDTLNNGLFPATAGESHEFLIRDPDGNERTVTLVSEIITSDPVQNVKTVQTASGTVGYLLFNDHIATAEQGLINAVNDLASENITDLVIDIRYNGGGFLFIASEFAHMIAGSNATAGRTFEVLRFNDKHPSTNPVTGQPLEPIPFFNTSNSGQALPTLDLPRVFVLTGPGTCSASESIINGLRGIDVEVIQIGSTTCGKPYGFYPTDNCGTTYFTIQFSGENDKGFGDYADGFSPENTGGPLTTPIPGCSVADDFSHPLGDPDEGRFAAALGYIAGMDCPAPTGVALPGVSKPGSASYSDEDMVLPRSPLREMRILDR